jgi:para-nitrobenzyl esterase
MRGYWTSLAKFGTPGGGWPRFTPSAPVWRTLVPPKPVNETDFAAEHHCSFWAAAG